MNRFTLLVLLCIPLNAQELIQDNVRLGLSLAGIPGSVVIGSTLKNGAAVRAEPTGCGSADLLAAEMSTERWKQTTHWLTKLNHGSETGWRQQKRPSLNVVRHEDPSTACGYWYEVDIDKNYISYRHFWLSGLHGVEFLRNSLGRGHTNQSTIAKRYLKRAGTSYFTTGPSIKLRVQH